MTEPYYIALGLTYLPEVGGPSKIELALASIAVTTPAILTTDWSNTPQLFSKVIDYPLQFNNAHEAAEHWVYEATGLRPINRCQRLECYIDTLLYDYGDHWPANNSVLLHAALTGRDMAKLKKTPCHSRRTM